MTAPDPAVLRELWRRLPVDDQGYRTADELLALPDRQLVELIEQMTAVRYGGWRNHAGRYRALLGLDDTTGRRVLDYGCGVGLDALQYAKGGNRVVVADLWPATVDLAWRVLDAFEAPAWGSAVIGDGGQLNPDFGTAAFDVIHMSGVLHHIPDPAPVLAHCARWLTLDGELRLLLYSDRAWRRAVGTDPPAEVTADPGLETYAAYQDFPGGYADWYDPGRLATRAGRWFQVARCDYLGPEETLLAATLVPLEAS